MSFGLGQLALGDVGVRVWGSGRGRVNARAKNIAFVPCDLRISRIDVL